MKALHLIRLLIVIFLGIMCIYVCMYVCIYLHIYVCRYIHIYVMFTLVHHLLKKRLIMRSTIGVISQVVNMGINIKFYLLIAKSATFIKTAKLC